jgi:GntR family transcriptional regulator
MAVDLHVNYNTVARAYQELERTGIVNTMQGKGTFVASQPVPMDEVVRATKLRRLVNGFLAKAAEFGFTPEEVLSETTLRVPESGPRRER